MPLLESGAEFRQRKGDAVYLTIKGRLVRGEHELGSPLSVTELAVTLGASRQPVMEALKRLQSEGMVEIIPQVGCRVAAPSAGEVSDFYEVFATMEGLASRLAAERREPADVDECRALARQLSSAVESGRFDNARYADLNRRFHGAIHRMARSREARAAAEMYWDRSDFLIASTRPPFWRTNLEKAEEEHAELCEAIAAGRKAQAQKLAYEHIRSFGNAVLEHLLEVGP